MTDVSVGTSTYIKTYLNLKTSAPAHTHLARYRLDHLKNMCEEELVKRVEASNAADILR